MLQRFILSFKNFKSVRLRAIFSQLDNFRIENFRTCQISKSKVLQRISFWSEIDLWKNSFWWKFCFEKISFGSFYPLKAHFCSYVFSQNPKIIEKIGKKNSFPINTCGENQILKQVFNNASSFESRNSNASDLEPIFHNSANFESKILERVGFWIKILKRISFWSEIDF